MPARTFTGAGVGVGVGAGCGFGVGWGFGGGPTGIAGSGVGGGCGVGLGLGWGYGSALGAHYIVVKPEFEKDNPVKPLWKKQLDNALSRIPIPFPGKPERQA